MHRCTELLHDTPHYLTPSAPILILSEQYHLDCKHLNPRSRMTMAMAAHQPSNKDPKRMDVSFIGEVCLHLLQKCM